jgi:hypothetical protein
MAELPRPPASPCSSCPYRRDVASGIWAESEYDKLPDYDGETWEQSQKLFMCHQLDGNLCAGWLACHGADDLLALRLHRVDPSAYDYRSPVSVFTSGREARDHGLAQIAEPDDRAIRIITKLNRRRGRKAG